MPAYMWWGLRLEQPALAEVNALAQAATAAAVTPNIRSTLAPHLSTVASAGAAYNGVVNSTSPGVNHGPRLNDWVTDALTGLPRTTGPGGDYPDGYVRLPAGTYYMDPFDMTAGGPCVRAYDATKPFGNALWFVEKDGPGTVFFDLRPESAQAYRPGSAPDGHQTLTEAYNDVSHGGGFRANGNGSLKWIFDGQFTWQNGTVSLGAGAFPGAQDLIFHGNRFVKTIQEWRRQYDIIYNLRTGLTAPAFLPNDSPPSARVDGNGPEPSGGPYWQVYDSDTRWKGGNQPTCIRGNGCQRVHIIRCEFGPCGDDAIFGGIDLFSIIGCVIHEVGTSNGGALGQASAWFHPDIFQSAGGVTKGLICDTTWQGHLNLGAEFGHIQNLVVDRCWNGNCGIIGGIAYKSSVWNMNGTKFGTGAPQTRITGHYLKGFSNGIEHNDGGPQVGYQLGDNGFHCVLQESGGAVPDLTGATFANISVAVPANVTVNPSNGFMTSSLSTFLTSPSVPHVIFGAAYGLNELPEVMSDYGIAILSTGFVLT